MAPSCKNITNVDCKNDTITLSLLSDHGGNIAYDVKPKVERRPLNLEKQVC